MAFAALAAFSRASLARIYDSVSCTAAVEHVLRRPSQSPLDVSRAPVLHCTAVSQLMSQMGQKQTSHCVRAVSAFPSKADLIGVMVVSDHRPGGALEPGRRQCERQV